MNTLQLANQTYTAEEIIPLLASYKIIPQLLCEMIIDRAIAPISCTAEEIEQACQEFDRNWHLNGEAERLCWQNQYGLSQEQLENLTTRRLKVEKFKQQTWGNKLESYFLQRKRQLDRVIYALIRTQDRWLASEIYFRILEGEQSFAELAREYSEGPEAETGGAIGPVELGTLHPILAQLLCTLPVGEVQPPITLGEWYVIRRVEKFIPAHLDDLMRQRLLQEKFEAWFQEQLQQLSPQEQIWMGITARHQLNSTDRQVAA